VAGSAAGAAGFTRGSLQPGRMPDSLSPKPVNLCRHDTYSRPTAKERMLVGQAHGGTTKRAPMPTHPNQPPWSRLQQQAKAARRSGNGRSVRLDKTGHCLPLAPAVRERGCRQLAQRADSAGGGCAC
jgi:hypothetical protein